MTEKPVAPIPQSVKKDLSRQGKPLPLLHVKQDTSLKSCLSSTSFNKSSSSVSHPEHPLFLVHDDIISPNKHGLLNDDDESILSHTPSLITGAGSSNLGNTGVIGPVLSPSQSHNSPSSILSSAPNSPPLIQAHNPNTHQIQTTVSPPPQPVPLSRISSLRYANAGDKNLIETTNRQRAGSPISSKSSPQLPPISDPNIVSNTDAVPNNDLQNDKKHLMIAITGCISIHKNIFLIIEKLFELYTKEKLEIQVILTKAAQYILGEKLYKFEDLGVKVWFHDDGLKYYLTNKATLYKAFSPQSAQPHPKLTPNYLSQFFLPFELQKWTDVLLIAPLSANSMAKLINGLSDNLLTDMLHIWPVPLNRHQIEPQAANTSTSTVLTNNLSAPKSIIAALALTNSMYSHPITKRQLSLLQETYPNMIILKPVEKCVDIDGNIAMGGMRSWREVVNFVVQKLGEPEEEDNDDDDDDDDDEDEDEEVKDGEEGEDRSEQKETTIRVNGHAKHQDEPSTEHHRIRSETVTNKELKEHTKIATINAMLNTGLVHGPTSEETKK
ncbi:putative protein Sis2p [[Candida] railenensis]|uniref:Flavoprotein domain-containing protein n=1 Tax=[Candida] railenensis TaxID=45579 RepID=A0A9P0QP80_9ASCO|nr:putative protein Sis2p [[Candida] railenensis]